PTARRARKRPRAARSGCGASGGGGASSCETTSGGSRGRSARCRHDEGDRRTRQFSPWHHRRMILRTAVVASVLSLALVFAVRSLAQPVNSTIPSSPVAAPPPAPVADPAYDYDVINTANL